jgi:alanine racemase
MADTGGPSDTGSARARAGAVLTIDLEAIKKNYRRLRQELRPVTCAAVVKANAYGLGVARVAPALAKAGARTFFTAQFDEALQVQNALGKTRPTADIFVLNGLAAAPSEDFIGHGLNPVLNSLGEIGAWADAARAAGRALPAAVHIDTGMNRLGLPRNELDTLATDTGRLNGIEVRYVMSHLACADESAHPLNAEQRLSFESARALLPAAPASLANSSGIFLGADYHFDLARPGAALYGVNPTPDRPNPMAQVIRLQGRILQVREIDAPSTVGYGASRQVPGGSRVATVAVGYADGFLRSLSDRAQAWIGERSVPVIGRVSMDLIALDISALPAEAARPGDFVDLIGPNQDVDALARAAGTIGYEILTSLGARYHRVYLGG